MNQCLFSSGTGASLYYEQFQMHHTPLTSNANSTRQEFFQVKLESVEHTSSDFKVKLENKPKDS